MVELRNVTKSFSGGWLNQMNYRFNKTGLYGILGTSKERNTFLNLIGMKDLDFEGNILYYGKNILPHDTLQFIEKNVCITKEIELEENKSIIGNLKSTKGKEEEIFKDLKKFGLDEMSKKRIKTLTEEERKIVHLLKCLNSQKELYIMEEEELLVSSKNQKKVWKKIEQLSKKALVIIGCSKKRVLENITWLRLENGNLIPEAEELEQNVIEPPITPQNDLKGKKLEKENKMTSIFFFAFIFFFLFTALTFQTINSNSIHSETLKQEDSLEIFLKLNGKNLTNEEIERVKKSAQISYGKTYSEVGTFMGLSGKKAVSSSEYPIFYNAIMSIPIFYVVPENTQLDLLVGTHPKKENEIVITKIVADFILYKGILTTDNSFFEPKSYEEIVSGANNISYGGIPVSIVGIVNQDLEQADTFKTKKESELTREEYFSFQDFSDRNNKYHTTYVNEYFANYVKIYRQGKKIEENITEIRIVTEDANFLRDLIERYEKEGLEIESIVSNRLAKYQPMLKALKMIGSILTFVFILCFFLQVMYIIVYNIKYQKKKEATTIKELFHLINIGGILGFILFLGYVCFINEFISHKLFIYFHILEIHLFPILLIVVCTQTIAYCLTKYFYGGSSLR